MNQTLKQLETIRATQQGTRISFVSGNFNIIHMGHVRLLRFAREISEVLVVGIYPGNDYNAAIPTEDRLGSVQSLNMVDFAFVMDRSVEDTLRALRPDFVVKGKEHEDMINLEQPILIETGGKLVFSAGFVRPSERDIISDPTANVLPQLVNPSDYLKRHDISALTLRPMLDKIRTLRVCVIGDVIVDEYITCDALGMSQEDPTLVVSPSSTRSFLGGAGIVAAHAAGLGATVRFFSISGSDETAKFVAGKLQDYNVTPQLFSDSSRPTTLKQRYRCQGKTLLRVSHLRQHAVSREVASTILAELATVLSQTDLLIFSDFNYGCLPQYLVDEIITLAKQYGVPFVADSQSSSQVGDVSRFRGARLLTPTEREARLAAHDFDSGLVGLAEKLLKSSSAENIVITLGAAGLMVQNELPTRTDRLPALNSNAKDVAGAGDSFLTTTSLILCTGGDIWHAVYLGSLAAGLQVSREGNIPLQRQLMLDYVETMHTN